MKTIIAIAILLTSFTLSFAQDFDLPEVILYHLGQPREGEYGNEFTCVGDQNGDGYDDLLINNTTLNRVELYHGGEEMDSEPDFLFSTEEEYISIGRYLRFVGNLLPDRAPFIAVSKLYLDRRNPPTITNHRLFESGDELDTEPEYNFGGGEEFYLVMPNQTHRSRPFDFNGDGYDEHVATKYIDETVSLEIFFGGAEFDTVADWSSDIVSTLPTTRISTGYDVNNDGYDDMLVACNPQSRHHIELYLGGEEPDEEPYLEIPNDAFEETFLYWGFSLLPDVNGDGYDDWGLHFMHNSSNWDGYYLFYGGEEPDIEPDLQLDGNGFAVGAYNDGEICGGDFNNDGYGDIVTGDFRAIIGDGQLNYFFGRPQMREEADIVINMREDFEVNYQSICKYIGAVGDYNGDGVDDVVTAYGGEGGRVLILAGNDDWQVNGVDEELPTDFELSLDAYPNPFNDTSRLSFDLPLSGKVKLSIYDTEGRLQEELVKEQLSRGSNTTIWNAQGYPTGMYFAVLNCTTRITSKTIVRKLILLR